ncbi:MAG: hypothetical protein Q4A55_06580 [Aerococcus sp.]|nr:hypothetical protein [Aerococcus sp.]
MTRQRIYIGDKPVYKRYVGDNKVWQFDPTTDPDTITIKNARWTFKNTYGSYATEMVITDGMRSIPFGYAISLTKPIYMQNIVFKAIGRSEKGDFHLHLIIDSTDYQRIAGYGPEDISFYITPTN